MVSNVNITEGLCGSRWRRLNTGHGEGNKLRRNNNSNTGAAPERQDDEEGETFTAGVRAIWQRPTCAGSLAKDLPRLARRITVKTRTGRCVPLPFLFFFQQKVKQAGFLNILECVRKYVAPVADVRRDQFQRAARF